MISVLMKLRVQLQAVTTVVKRYYLKCDSGMMMKSANNWTCKDVAIWLRANGFDDYVHLLAEQHKIDGQALLLLHESDLRTYPLSLNVLGDIKRLTYKIAELRRQNCGTLYYSSRDIALNDIPVPGVSHRPKFQLSSISPPVANDVVPMECLEQDSFGAEVGASPEDMSRPSIVSYDSENEITREKLKLLVESPDTDVKSLWKTVIAAAYCSLSLLITSFVMVIVHDRVPDMKTYPPLPDIFLDNIPLIPWAFQVCEVCACAMALIFFTIIFFHKRRVVLMRRMFSLTGTVFLLRCVTMLITSLSVPGIHLECQGKNISSLSDKVKKAFHIWTKMGMSIRGVSSCGDYMFSGHTVAVTLLNHFITEYSPQDWHYLHTTTWVLNLFGIFFILAAHEHYSLDVFVAFYISSRLFVYYHTMAYAALHLTQSDERTRMWFPLFWFFESGGHVGRVLNEYEWPLPSLTHIVDKLNLILAGGRKAILEKIESVKIAKHENRDSARSDSSVGFYSKRRKKSSKFS